MAQAYIRQSTFADGDTITAALFNDEYNQRYPPSVGSNEFVNLDLEDIPDPTTAESSVLRSRKSTKKKKK